MTRILRMEALFLAALLAGCSSTVKSPEPVDPAPTLVSAESVVLSDTPWYFGDDVGVQLQTNYYRIFTTVREGVMRRRLPLFLETALHEYMTAFGPLPPPPAKLYSYVLATRPQWVQRTKELMGDKADRFTVIERGGFASRGRGVFWDIGLQGTFVIAAHEGWHQYLQQTFQHRIPVWLDEGLATYMESFRWDPASPDRPIFTGWSNVERFDYLRRAEAEGSLVSLQTLLSQTPQELIQQSDELALTYYAQVWALIHFLREGEDGKYNETLHRLLVDASSGQIARVVQLRLDVSSRQAASMLARGPAVFRLYFNPDLDQAAAEYDAFIDQIVATRSRDKIVAGRSPISGRRPSP